MILASSLIKTILSHYNTIQKIYSVGMIYGYVLKSYFGRDVYLITYILHHLNLVLNGINAVLVGTRETVGQKVKMNEDSIEWMIRLN